MAFWLCLQLYQPALHSPCHLVRFWRMQHTIIFLNSREGRSFGSRTAASWSFRINRLLFMVPVYAVSNLLATIYFNRSIYFELVGNAYAAIGLASFFNLLYAYVTEGSEDPKDFFRTLQPKPWQWPLSWPRTGRRPPFYSMKTPRSGLTWLNVSVLSWWVVCVLTG